MIQSRLPTRKLKIGAVPVGGDAPIVVQSMTNTPTTDVVETVRQIQALHRAGAEVVRVSVNSSAAAESMKAIIAASQAVPLVADIHFDYRIAIKMIEAGIAAIRMNPGNIGRWDRIQRVIETAKAHNVPIRIGVNAGSLEPDLLKKYTKPTPEALVESALRHAEFFQRANYDQFKISVKASDPLLTVSAYRLLAKETRQPLHLGVTEAGGLRGGTVKSSMALGILLAEGIGDTIRISLAADPIEEVRVAYDLLRALGLRHRGVELIACPTCARKEIDVIGIVSELENRIADISTPMKVSVIGCIVNGPGEALQADIGVVGGRESSAVYKAGQRTAIRFRAGELVDQLEAAIREMAEKRAS